ncbi:MAG: hypothetical protein AAFY20_01685 [Cyanobacteria bacterium J06639_14]
MKTAKLQFTPQWHRTLADYVTAIAWSPQGDAIAVTSAAGEVLLHHLSSDTTTPLRSPDGNAINCLGFAPSGQFLAAAGQTSEVSVWSALPPHHPITPLPHHSPAWIDQLAWHPHQNILAYGLNSQVQIWDVEQQTTIADLDFQDSSVLHLVWHPQGDWLAVSGHGGLKVWSAGDWRSAPQSVEVPGASLYAAWSADGRYLGSGNLDRTLTVAEWDNPPPWLMQGFPGKVRQLAWSLPMTKSGSPLLAAACVEGVTVWERATQAGGGWRSQVLQHHTERVNAIAFQPHSLLLASASQDGQIGFWQQGKQLVQTLKGFQEGVACIGWNAAGDHLAAGGTTGEVQIWKIAPRAQGFG